MGRNSFPEWYLVKLFIQPYLSGKELQGKPTLDAKSKKCRKQAKIYLDVVLLCRSFVFILSVKRENLKDGGGLKVYIVGQGMPNLWS